MYSAKKSSLNKWVLFTSQKQNSNMHGFISANFSQGPCRNNLTFPIISSLPLNVFIVSFTFVGTSE